MDFLRDSSFKVNQAIQYPILDSHPKSGLILVSLITLFSVSSQEERLGCFSKRSSVLRYSNHPVNDNCDKVEPSNAWEPHILVAKHLHSISSKKRASVI